MKRHKKPNKRSDSVSRLLTIKSIDKTSSSNKETVEQFLARGGTIKVVGEYIDKIVKRKNKP